MGMGWVIPPSVHEGLDRLGGLVAATPGGLRVGDRAIPSDAPGELLAEAIYDRWYLAAPTGSGAAGEPPDPFRSDLVGVLRASHAGSTRFEPGWVVLAVAARGACTVGRDGVQRLVRPTEYAGLSRPGAPVAPGEEVAVTTRIDTVDEATRWWASRSPSGEPAGPLGRFYIHPSARSVGAVVRALTLRLMDAPFAWSIKASTVAAGYARPDALVVYVPRRDHGVAGELIAAVVAETGSALVPHTPPLTQPLAPGAAYADDPGPDSSFGSHRCAALADGVTAVAAAGASGREAVDMLVASLAAAGIDPARPWQAGDGA